jgi:hypothetical protein
MITISRRLFICALIFMALSVARPARATQVMTINCNTAVHLADFISCANLQAFSRGSGIYVTFGATKFTTVTITAQWAHQTWFPYVGFWAPTSTTATKQNGAPALVDTDLDSASLTLLAAVKGNIPGLTVPPDQIYSLLDVSFPEILTNQIDGALLSALGALYTTVTPIGTIVMVTCAGDGTNAQFTRISMTGTVQWEMVPGTLKNKAGKFIDSSGNVIANGINNLNLGLPAAALPNFPGYGLDPTDWLFWNPLPNGTATVAPCNELLICSPE